MEKKRTTENQIDIFYYPNRHTHSFCLSLYIKAGELFTKVMKTMGSHIFWSTFSFVT